MSAGTPNPHNLAPENIYSMMVADFRDGWDALAESATTEGRGNFRFAQAGMGILEFASRLCHSDATGNALRDLSAELERIQPLYFTELPSAVARPGGAEFLLPHNTASSPDHQLLWALFDVIRHGQAHQGQQCMVELNDGTTFVVSISGADQGVTLDRVRARRYDGRQLSLRRLDAERAVLLRFQPATFFIDLTDAIGAANLMGRGLAFPYLVRPRRQGDFDFSADELWHALTSRGHAIWPPLARDRN